MKFGVLLANILGGATPEGATTVAQAAEAAGLDSLWVGEHVVVPVEYTSQYPASPDGRMPIRHSDPLPDPLIWLTWAAAKTSRIRLGTGVLILPERNPAILAKQTATLDYLSGGRLELGVGLGWLKEEYEALGIPWERRGARADEYIAALRALWAHDDASFTGEFVQFSRISVNPKPPRGTVPISVGAFSKPAARRAGRLGDSFQPAPGNRELILELLAGIQTGSTATAVHKLLRETAELIDIAHQSAADAGRDPAALAVIGLHPLAVLDPKLLSHDPLATVEELAAIGVDEYLYPAYFLTRPSITEAFTAFADQVITPYNKPSSQRPPAG